MTKPNKPNGGIAELTPDAIRADGLSVAEHIRQLGKKAFTQGEDVAAFADEVATAVVEATNQVADRIARLMENCESARQSMELHRTALTALPEPRKALAPPAALPGDVGLEAVERSMAELGKIAEPSRK